MVRTACFVPTPPPHITPSAGKSLHGMEKQLLLVANAHMHWDPEYSDVKLVQTMMFLSEVKNIVDKATRSLKLSSVSGETNAIPLVLCADLNSLPDSGKYRLNHVPRAHPWLYLVSVMVHKSKRSIEGAVCIIARVRVYTGAFKH